MSGGAYSVLGVSRSASKKTIRDSYLRLVKQLHPDVNSQPEAPKRFKQVQHAYELLADANKRKEHDVELDARFPRGPTVRSAQAGMDAAYRRQQATRWMQQARGRGRYGSAAEEAHKRQAAAEFARVHAQYQQAFKHDVYRQAFVGGLMRIGPLLLPLWLVLAAVTLARGRQSNEPQGRVGIFFDEYGRAYVDDNYGKRRRIPDFDRQR
eukprot:NODE_14936_length_1077_cov_2.521053.p1 GENE.NODE_14936_length_1077_cov_2.521053~~NODE_14936_length_1077_cov_2.521053.p1  ORF type:complete len:209 (-),score=41.49 NODE_14936_length_1077_cov_2.521053:333-959(-)